jgi:hypothetical protein
LFKSDLSALSTNVATALSQDSTLLSIVSTLPSTTVNLAPTPSVSSPSAPKPILASTNSNLEIKLESSYLLKVVSPLETEFSVTVICL